jgi:hypothetical protein
MLRIPFVEKRVTPPRHSTSAALSPRARLLAALVGIGLMAVLFLAGNLRPDPRGWGTHEQLGLPPCTLKALTGWRCPACGMTTSWSLAVQGRLAEALRVHVSGTVLAVVAAGVSVLALAVAVRGRWFAWQMSDTAMAVCGLTTIALVIVEWIWRLAAN